MIEDKVECIFKGEAQSFLKLSPAPNRSKSSFLNNQNQKLIMHKPNISNVICKMSQKLEKQFGSKITNIITDSFKNRVDEEVFNTQYF